MVNLISMVCEYKHDINPEYLLDLWGDSWNKLSHKQKQLVSEIFSNNSNRKTVVRCRVVDKLTTKPEEGIKVTEKIAETRFQLV